MRIDYDTWIAVVRDIEEYIPKLINACDSVSELFYEQMNDESWVVFAQLLEGYENLYKALYMTVEDAKDHQIDIYESLYPLVERFPMQLIDLNREMQAENHVAVGDMIKHEWQSLLAETLNTLKGKVVYG